MQAMTPFMVATTRLEARPSYRASSRLRGFFHFKGRTCGSFSFNILDAINVAIPTFRLTYIGNAPNLMVYAIAGEQGVRMPSFFGYLLWAVCVLVPLFMILTLLPISPILKLP